MLLLEPRFWDAGEGAQGSSLALSPCGEESRSSGRKLLPLGDSCPSPRARGRYLGCLPLLGHPPGFPNLCRLHPFSYLVFEASLFTQKENKVAAYKT